MGPGEACNTGNLTPLHSTPIILFCLNLLSIYVKKTEYTKLYLQLTILFFCKTFNQTKQTIITVLKQYFLRWVKFPFKHQHLNNSVVISNGNSGSQLIIFNNLMQILILKLCFEA